MEDSEQNKNVSPEGSQPESSRLLLEAERRRESLEALSQAMQENILARPDLKVMAWKALLVSGALLFAYFVSLAFTDRSRFGDGLAILWQGAKQLVVMLILAVCLAKVYFRASPAQRKWLDRIGVAIAVVLLVGALLFFRGVIGMVSGVDKKAAGSSVWRNGYFLLTLGAELFAGWALYRARQQCKAYIEIGETDPGKILMLVYFLEALLIYVAIALYFQAVFQINMPAILQFLLARKLFFAFSFPLLGYVFLRRLMEE